MKFQVLFSLKNNKKKFRMPPATNLPSTLWVKIIFIMERDDSVEYAGAEK